MTTFELLSIIIAAAALAISIYSAITTTRSQRSNDEQTRIMRAELDELKKHKFTDEPYNAYTVKLESISNNIIQVAKAISNSKK